MGNYQLKAEVSRLQAELSKVEAENSALRAEIGSAVNGVNQANKNLADYNQHIRDTLDNANNSINRSINRTVEAYEIQGQIDQLYTRYKSVELANKNIRALNNKKYYDFNNFRTIRKIVQGMMDNLDLNMVSDAVIYKSVERQHLLTPDFWLTPVLISIMAWKGNDKALAERAIETAVRLDKKNSSVFYMIFNLRMDRNDAAVKWFLEYQKCELTGDDEHTFLMMFSLISKTLTDKVDDATERMIEDYIHKLILDCAQREGYSESDMISIIVRRMMGLVKAEAYEFPTLAKYCKGYNKITRMLDLANNNYNILEFILKIVNVPVAERNTYLKEYINELLAKPNSVEIDTYDQIEYNEMIIKMGGDVEGAKEAIAQKLAKREAKFDIISSIISWIYDFGNEDINGQMRLNMFTLVKTLQDKGTTAYFDNYRSLYSSNQIIEVLDYSATIDFNSKDKEIENAEHFYKAKEDDELATVKNTTAYIAFAVAVACGVGAFFTSFFLFAGTAIGALVGIGTMVSNRFKKKNISLKINAQSENVKEIMCKMYNEFAKMRELYKEYDAISKNITEEIAKL